ncbi:polyamine aminopropyltransferase [Neisseria sp. Dent CA1/247]|uniref:Spermidine synthase n=1 Tax=Neisseria zoodegmatis TaxID=326523 RepID=A0A378WGV6_9NEIS|nr:MULTISPECIES: polyamine aminopropyltransferase [Neisseria]MDO5070230.1 polyamine aminopropyltransferase [Neisseria zoodegmatis]UOO76075.1 polyamine aminopropyltransferase [Neisseria sp. Dent CA1/247]SUA35764.1 spermidine synthase [Neisseria zoodegmatis]
MAHHPYRRLRAQQTALPEVGISESGNIRSLHLGSSTVQSSMNLDHPAELVLSYSRAMMGWLLFAEQPPAHITQIGLGGGSFARWIDAYLPETRQTAIDINPQVINVARSLFELPFEDERFEIIEADGAEYIKTLRGSTDVILTDGFDGHQIIDALVEEPFFQDCRQALSPNGIFVTNWWSGDRRYQRFVERLLNVFEGRVLELPAESHGNVAVMAFQSSPKEQRLDNLKKRADKLSKQYDLDFKRMLSELKAGNTNNGKHFYL